MRKDFKLSKTVEQIIKDSSKMAKERHQYTIDHATVLLQTMLMVKDDKIPELKEYFGKVKDMDQVIDSLIQNLGEPNDEANPLDPTLEPILDRDMEDVMDAAQQYTKDLGRNRVEADVVMLGLLGHDEFEIIDELRGEYGITGDELAKTLKNGNNRSFNDVLKGMDSNFMSSLMDMFSKKNTEAQDKLDEENFEKFGSSEPINSSAIDPNSETPYLDQFSDDMTKRAKNGEYDPVIGREDIVDSITEILCKRKKANVALVGVAGSGKSTVVERLSQRIVEGKVPEQLKNKRICSLNLNDLVAGTKYRGEYEERLQKIIKEVCNSKNVIVYIDELHNLVGSGSSSGNGDGANILKPYLAKGEFQCIGSTTNEEYRKFIEKDAALNRRFTQVEIKEPSQEETVKILMGVKGSYEKFHQVRFEKEAIERCVEWSSRFITDKNQPDKAIDIMDLSGSLAALGNDKKEDSDELMLLRKKLVMVKEQKNKAVIEAMDFELGEKLRDEEKQIQAEIAKLTKSSAKSNRKDWNEVSLENVALAVSKISRVPVDKINMGDRDRLKLMKEELSKKVVGQDKAVSTVVKNLQRSWLGLRQPDKPVFSGMFVGNTGTGKTLICKEIAKIFFGSEKNLIKIDCGELRDRSSVSKLTGTTAGYVGYDDEPLLLQIKRTPNCILLLDEIDKCDPSIYEIFMNILDEGYCILGDSTRVDFTNAVIIFTGNVGTKELQDSSRSLGFAHNEDKNVESERIVMKAVKKMFKPEFINRLNSIVVFNELGKPEMNKIFTIELDKLKKQFGKNKIGIKVSGKMKDHVVSQVNLSYGARDLKRLIETWILDPISEAMLENAEASRFVVEYNKELNKSEVSVI
jgi:ATP-dependent Clp protease ATP-binding subunit ClpC